MSYNMSNLDINLNEFLYSISSSLDVIETEIFGVPTKHSMRIAYIACVLGIELKMSDEQIFDLAALALLHDNGATMSILESNKNDSMKQKLNLVEKGKVHCKIGEENIKHFPFLTVVKNSILFHHENYDGTGFFGLSGANIPLYSQIIHFADSLDLNFDLNRMNREKIRDYAKSAVGTIFSPAVVEAFQKVSLKDDFWESIDSEHIDDQLKKVVPNFYCKISYKQLREITRVFSNIIDAVSVFTQDHSSGLSERISLMARYYKFDEDLTMKLIIASDLHDLGKLSISKKILDKPGPLTQEEFAVIKKHPNIARNCLMNITGFEDISLWILNHHEKLDGSGYPRQLTEENLDFYSRLLTCMDIYQALRETRPYRNSMCHDEAIVILKEMAEDGKLDRKIVEDIESVFRNEAISENEFLEGDSLTRNLFEGVYKVDINRRIMYWNKGAEAITGYSASDVRKHYCFDNLLNHVDENGVALCFGGCPLRETIEDGLDREAFVFLQHKDGYRVPVKVRTSPLFNSQNKLIGALEFFTENKDELSLRDNLNRVLRESYEDPLTGISNRRYLTSIIESKIREFRLIGKSFGVAFIDIDNFKRINDSYGHDVGDSIIKILVSTIQQNLRKSDFVGRWGGEEFLIIFSDVSIDELVIAAEKTRTLVASSSLRLSDQDLNITISIGATLVVDSDDPESIVTRADQLMYISKRTGKNKVTID
ncbi:MAG: diguanylate cyclase [Erysipelotrichaceae bacterium]|nr:diguanylate cyclase [Erysipelotrichaceae bacterium]